MGVALLGGGGVRPHQPGSRSSHTVPVIDKNVSGWRRVPD